MALQGTFVANFDDFDKKVTKAQSELDALKASADRVGPSVDAIGGSSRLTTFAADATASAGAVDAFSSATTKAAAASTSWYQQLADGVLKGLPVYNAALAETNANAELLATTFSSNLTQGTQSAAGGFSQLFSEISAGRQSLNAFGAEAGLTVQNLGLIESGALVAGSAFAGWTIGRWIAELGDFDKSIGATAAALFGLGDQAAEVAAAKQDELALAISRNAKNMNSYADAIAYNKQWVKNWIEAAQEMDNIAARLDAPQKSAEQIAKWNAELQKVQDAGVLSSLRSDIESGNFSLTKLSNTYRISTDAIKLFISENKAADEAFERQQKALDNLDKQWEKTAKQSQAWAATLADIEGTGATFTDVFNSMDGAIVDWAKDLLVSGHSAEEVAKYYGLTEAQVKALETANRMDSAALKDHTAALKADQIAAAERAAALDKLASDSIKKFDDMNNAVMGIDTSFKGWNKDVMALGTSLKNLDLGGSQEVTSQNFEQAFKNIATVGGNLPTGLAGFDQAQAYDLARRGYSFEEIIAIMQNQRSGANGSLPPPHGPKIPGFAGGVQDFGGGTALVGEHGPEIVKLPKGSDVIPFGKGGGGTTVIVNIGPVNGSAMDVANQIERQLMRRLQSARQFGAA